MYDKKLYQEAVDLINDMAANRLPTKFADVKLNSDALRNKLIELNGGSNKLSAKNMYPGHPVFEIIQETLPIIVHEGLTGDEFFMSWVEYRNSAMGDSLEFVTPDNTELIVADASYGTDGIRRQRLHGQSTQTLPTQLKVIKVYDEWRRLMAGQSNFDELIRKVSEAMIKRLNEDIYSLFDAIASDSSVYMPTAGTYDERALLNICRHVAAANDSSVTIMGNLGALTNIEVADPCEQAKLDMYNMGYYGKFHGINVMFIKDRHKVGTDDFIIPDNKLWIMAGGDKPFKVVTHGEGLAYTRNPFDTVDHTWNYFYGQDYGMAYMPSAKNGLYTMSK